ncbi:MAG: class I SAM-dependent methyltransferase [Bacteroidales bacterium]
MKFRQLYKGLYFAGRFHFVTPQHLLNFLAHLSGLSKFIHKHKKGLKFNDFYSPKFNYRKRLWLFEKIIESENLKDINYLEFGVENAGSFKWWLDHVQHKEARFYGFDTFSGLPEDWGPFRKGDMSAGSIPEIDDDRHEFIQGLFQQTLPEFLKNFDNTKRKVIHLDADLYTSTYFVLTRMAPLLRPGDILFFDEFNVPLHEYKAFTEFVNSYYIDYEVLGAVNNFYQIAVKIK